MVDMDKLKKVSDIVNGVLEESGLGHITVAPLTNTDFDACGYCRFSDDGEDAEDCEQDPGHDTACAEAWAEVCKHLGVPVDGNNITITSAFSGMGVSSSMAIDTIPDPQPGVYADVPFMVGYIMSNMEKYRLQNQALAIKETMNKNPGLLEQYRKIS